MDQLFTKYTKQCQGEPGSSDLLNLTSGADHARLNHFRINTTETELFSDR